MESTHKHNETMHVLMFAVCMHVVMLDMERHAADPLKVGLSRVENFLIE